MTIEELIRLLESYPPDMRVVVSSYEEGYDDLSPEQVSVVKIELDAGTHEWEGQHGEYGGSGDNRLSDALVLRRMSN